MRNWVRVKVLTDQDGLFGCGAAPMGEETMLARSAVMADGTVVDW
jgi:hypothetical protein